jgi:hypothetical protein
MQVLCDSDNQCYRQITSAIRQNAAQVDLPHFAPAAMVQQSLLASQLALRYNSQTSTKQMPK